jgi:hypothetical protein
MESFWADRSDWDDILGPERNDLSKLVEKEGKAGKSAWDDILGKNRGSLSKLMEQAGIALAPVQKQGGLVQKFTGGWFV